MAVACVIDDWNEWMARAPRATDEGLIGRRARASFHPRDKRLRPDDRDATSGAARGFYRKWRKG